MVAGAVAFGGAGHQTRLHVLEDQTKAQRAERL